MDGLDRIETIAEWEQERDDGRPAPFELFFADRTPEAVLRYDEPGRFDGTWLRVKVRRPRLGNAFDLEIVDAAVQGPVADEYAMRRMAEGAERVPAMIGTGMFRAFLREAERLAFANFFSAVSVVGVGDGLLHEALVRNGYRCFAAGSFRKIVRPLSRPRLDVCHFFVPRPGGVQLGSPA